MLTDKQKTALENAGAYIGQGWLMAACPRSPEEWATELDLGEVAEDAAALVASWRAIECADERARVEREQVGVALEASWPAGVDYDWKAAAIVATVERLYEATEEV